MTIMFNNNSILGYKGNIKPILFLAICNNSAIFGIQFQWMINLMNIRYSIEFK